MKWRMLFGSRIVTVVLATLVIAAISVAFHDPLDFDDRPQIERMLKLAVDSVQSDIVADMEARLLAQTRLAQLWKVNRISPQEWDGAARLFLAHQPGYMGVQLFDRSLRRQGTAVWGEHANGYEAVDFPAGDQLGQVLRSGTRSVDQEAMTVEVTLPDDRLGYLIVVPSFSGEEIVGYLAVLSDVSKTLESVLSDHVRTGFSVAVLRGATQLYQTDGSNTSDREGWSQTSKVPLAAVNWSVEVWPTPETLAEARSQLPELGAIFACLLILLLVSTIHFARKLQISSAHLQAAHDQLELRVQERTAELIQANDDLQDEIAERSQMEAILRKLSRDLLHSQDEERRRIARELHDSTAQTLSALKIKISSLRKLATLDASVTRSLLQQSGQLAEQALSEVRSMSYLLHPPILEDFGLESALTWYAKGFAERSGIHIDVEIDSDLGRFPQEVELIVFRIVQEALGNIHRHSGSPTAGIVLSRDDSEVRLSIRDEGCGLPKEVVSPEPGTAPRVGVGIGGMRERARQFGGELKITSSDQGTKLTVILPLAQSKPLATVA
jgi:signal transduction histidine kinase